jgi:hypothetical protein
MNQQMRKAGKEVQVSAARRSQNKVGASRSKFAGFARTITKKLSYG